MQHIVSEERFVIGYLDRDGSLRLYVPSGRPLHEYFSTNDLKSASSMVQLFEQGKTQDMAAQRPKDSKSGWQVYRQNFEPV